MGKTREFLDAYIEAKRAELNINVKHEDTGIAWAGFWIGVGLVIAAQVIVTGKDFIK